MRHGSCTMTNRPVVPLEPGSTALEKGFQDREADLPVRC